MKNTLKQIKNTFIYLGLIWILTACGSSQLNWPQLVKERTQRLAQVPAVTLSKSELKELSTALLMQYPELVEDLNYHPLEQQTVNQIYEHYGHLYIVPDTQWHENQATQQPWASYWYPRTDRSLFEGSQAPLQKLENALHDLGYENNIVALERQRYENSHEAARWEGLCDAWALASLRYQEPREDLIVGSQRFSPADQKAILTHITQNMATIRYGVIYRGNAETDGTFQDIRPEAFHQLITQYFQQTGQGLAIDDDPGIEVWSKPVFRYRYRFEQTEDPRIISGKAFLYFIHHRSDVSDVPTSSDDVARMILTFEFFVNPKPRDDQSLEVLWGRWTQASLSYHPDFVFLSEPNAQEQSSNSEINRLLTVIKEKFVIR